MKYVIVGGPKIGSKKIQYRRIRYMYYLAEHGPYNDVYWLYSSPGSLTDFGKVRSDSFLSPNGKRITSIEVSDFYFLLARGLLGRFIGRKIAKIIGPMDDGDILIYTLPRFALLAQLYEKALVVYDVSDNWRGQYSFKSIKSVVLGFLMYLTEKRIVNSSDKIMASSITLKNNLERRYDREVFLGSNGVDFSAIQDCPKAPGIVQDAKYEKTVGFCGSMLNRQIRDKIDVSLLIFLAKKRPHWCFFIIGPYSEVPEGNVKELQSISNVFFTGYIESSELGGYLKHLDIGLLPYLKNEFTDGIFPIKLYEYIAACLPVVSINLPATYFLSAESEFYRSTTDYDSFLVACDDLVEKQMSPKEKDSYSQLARNFDWKDVFHNMSDYIMK